MKANLIFIFALNIFIFLKKAPSFNKLFIYSIKRISMVELIKQRNILNINIDDSYYPIRYAKYYKILLPIILKYKFEHTVDKEKKSLKSIFNDPDINKQWYLKKINDSHLSHNLEKLWKKGITGKTVLIAILEGSIEVNHIDLKENFNIKNSYNFIENERYVPNNDTIHGTLMAGLISGVPNNSMCGIGTAPHSNFVSLTIIDSKSLRLDELILVRAFSYRIVYMDIYCNSWTPNSHPASIVKPSYYTRMAILRASRLGRFNRGSIIVFSAGNTVRRESNCAFNGYIQIERTFTFSSLTFDGKISSYAQSCTAIVAAALSSSEKDHYIYTTGKNNSCSESIGYTSASTAIATGILALLLGYNKHLTYSQILYLIATTSIQYDKSYIGNKAGYNHSSYIGFGLLDANALISQAKSPLFDLWPKTKICRTRVFIEYSNQLRNEMNEFFIYTSGCLNFDTCVSSIEEVLVNISLKTAKRKNVYLFITSPSGTKIKLIDPRRKDESADGLNFWTVKALSFYGERPVGVWRLEVYDPQLNTRLVDWSLTITGHCREPNENVKIHNRVVNYICKSKDIVISAIHNLLCYSESSFKKKPPNHDIYSFNMHDYPNIKKLKKYTYV